MKSESFNDISEIYESFSDITFQILILHFKRLKLISYQNWNENL